MLRKTWSFLVLSSDRSSETLTVVVKGKVWEGASQGAEGKKVALRRERKSEIVKAKERQRNRESETGS